ncbi:MAG: CDP-diacylglycerol--glycerol-3-phosphate 3-phosphatidyltransferase [Alphaproteobacteria bacterium]|nr:CDP-diacylglycerol--glycerol-3-phosphate 3-phosphatidyltransferase [Alphaproteobacteria bacterium]
MLQTPKKSATLINLPNALTLGRIAAVPLFVAILYFLPGDLARWLALAVFALASFTDWLDGHLARRWEQHSQFGAMLDPIADKLLVAAALIMLVADQTISGVHVFAALIILAREILVSGLREYLASLSVKIRVTQLAKWKTAIQMVAIALLIAGPAAQAHISVSMDAGLALLWIASLLTLWTGADYLAAAIRHAVDSDRSDGA